MATKKAASTPNKVTKVSSNHRDGFGQQAIHEGVAPYFPNSLGGGCPFHVGEAGFQHVPRPVAGTIVRERPQSFDDHFTQATMFWNSMTAPERDHIVADFSFELGKCVHPEVQERTLVNLADVDAELCARIAENLGMEPPAGAPATDAGASVEGVNLYVIAATGGAVTGQGGPVPVDRTVLTTQSVEYDALVVAGGAPAAALGSDPYAALNLGEAFRHHKVVAAWGEGASVLEACGITDDLPGVVVGEAADPDFVARLVESMGWHRHWDRLPAA